METTLSTVGGGLINALASPAKVLFIASEIAGKSGDPRRAPSSPLRISRSVIYGAHVVLLTQEGMGYGVCVAVSIICLTACIQNQKHDIVCWDSVWLRVTFTTLPFPSEWNGHEALFWQYASA